MTVKVVVNLTPEMKSALRQFQIGAADAAKASQAILQRMGEQARKEAHRRSVLAAGTFARLKMQEFRHRRFPIPRSQKAR